MLPCTIANHYLSSQIAVLLHAIALFAMQANIEPYTEMFAFVLSSKNACWILSIPICRRYGNNWRIGRPISDKSF
jgi:hypothetical protein